jgi:hypothetical protein
MVSFLSVFALCWALITRRQRAPVRAPDHTPDCLACDSEGGGRFAGSGDGCQS